MYSKGQGVEQDDSKASYWFSQGANKGDPRAMYNLAVFYEKGLYLPRDLDKARYWYQKASEKGLEKATDKLKSLSPITK